MVGASAYVQTVKCTRSYTTRTEITLDQFWDWCGVSRMWSISDASPSARALRATGRLRSRPFVAGHMVPMAHSCTRSKNCYDLPFVHFRRWPHIGNPHLNWRLPHVVLRGTSRLPVCIHCVCAWQSCVLLMRSRMKKGM